ncbi:MAG: UDP-N-acetylmuramoyl-L-alanine--D-glutamate ligase [Alphaproteobacteria bacterium]|nr:UDP-N-acetylmuramoyl-L-alanine--D-glutamate ligase [Alphaproteobacteria bacterium]
MIVFGGFANQDVGVFGLARTGMSVARSLVAGGARVFAWDDNVEAQRICAEHGARVLPFESWPWERLTALVLSPGVPLTHPVPHAVVSAAAQAAVPVIGDMDIFARELQAQQATSALPPVIAVTGTNGKSTTTVLISHILSSCGYVAELGGNIGRPVLDLGPPTPRSAYVLEVSSYQIELSPNLSPNVSVLTNISPDHLDRHGTLENYAAIKARLLQQTNKEGVVCIGVDDPYSAAIHSRFAASGGAEAIPVSVGKVLGSGIFVLDGVLYEAPSANPKIMDLRNASRLPGAHNWQNAALAFAATRRLVENRQAIADAIASFRGLPHRLEEVGRLGKVRFINDSKATNADAAARALACFNDIFWIAGGRPKEGGIESLRPLFSRVRKAYLIGEAADDFARVLHDVPHERCGTLDKAIAVAAHDAEVSDAAAPAVLLSPACASFDQFRDYERRGDAFREIVGGLVHVGLREAS